MATLKWDSLTPSHNGVSKGVLYLPTGPGVVWNGLVSIEETSDVEIEEDLYIDGVRYHIRIPTEDFNLKIQAITYPKVLDAIFDNQTKTSFNMSYQVGNQLHLVYNATVEPGLGEWQTESNEPETSLFEWNAHTKPIVWPNAAPTAHIVIELNEAWSEILTPLYNKLYGTVSTNAMFPTSSELVDIWESNTRYRIIDHGDGTWTAIGPAEAIEMTSPTQFRLHWDTATMIDSTSYTISSY